jgi:hypothetical protein
MELAKFLFGHAMHLYLLGSESQWLKNAELMLDDIQILLCWEPLILAFSTDFKSPFCSN